MSMLPSPRRNGFNETGEKRRHTTTQHRRAIGRARRKFIGYYPGGFTDPDYISLERGYKWNAHRQWLAALDRNKFRRMLIGKAYKDIAAEAVKIESRTNLLFSFEKMALRDAVKSTAGARAFTEGLFNFLHGDESSKERFVAWCNVVAELPRKQTRVLTWPLVTVWGFLAQPRAHFYLKPMVTRRAFDILGLQFTYRSRPNWESYSELLTLARTVKREVSDLGARDMIDMQSFLWVQGSDEYPD